jgi:hypothetical protein
MGLIRLLATRVSAAKMIEEVQNPNVHLKIKTLNLLSEVMDSSRREYRNWYAEGERNEGFSHSTRAIAIAAPRNGVQCTSEHYRSTEHTEQWRCTCDGPKARDAPAQLNVKIGGGKFRPTSAATKSVRISKGSHGFMSLDTNRVGPVPGLTANAGGDSVSERVLTYFVQNRSSPGRLVHLRYSPHFGGIRDTIFVTIRSVSPVQR